MDVLKVLAVAVGLGMDAMSVSAAVGVKWHGPRQKFRLAWHMGLFQFLMPIAGWHAGRGLAELLHAVGSYVAAALVFLVGAKMLYEAVRSRPGAVAERAEQAAAGLPARPASDPTRGWSLVLLSVATSVDALVVGLSLGLRRAGAIWWTSLVIGVVAGAMALTGVVVGQRVGKAVGRPAEIAGAIVLMGLGVSFLFW
jgi:putative Mn2+ efflux pump MntP